MRKEILDKLYEPFELKARPGQGGMTFKYVPSDDIVDRMNKVFMGDWSTEVVQSEVIGDQVLIRVRVYAKDPNSSDSKQYWQEGYASQLIAKYTQGPKAGQIIDVGNSYKSAMSKAIKTAVAKWGVGLYLEKDLVNEGSNAGSWGPPNIPTSPPEIKPVEQPKIAPVAPLVIPPVAAPVAAAPIAVPVAAPVNIPPGMPNIPFSPPVSAPVAVPVAAPVNTPSGNPLGVGVVSAPVAAPVNIPFGIPDIPFDTPVQAPVAAPVNVPVFTDANVVVTQPNQSASFNPPMDSIPAQGSVVESLTDVQKAAIENIMSVHNKSFAELAPAALQRTDNLPNAVENLSYQDAVKLIQYGNNLNTSS